MIRPLLWRNAPNCGDGCDAESGERLARVVIDSSPKERNDFSFANRCVSLNAVPSQASRVAAESCGSYLLRNLRCGECPLLGNIACNVDVVTTLRSDYMPPSECHDVSRLPQRRLSARVGKGPLVAGSRRIVGDFTRQRTTRCRLSIFRKADCQCKGS